MDHSKNIHHIFNTHAKRYEEKYMDVGQYHKSLNYFLEKLNNPNATILDIACGPGNVAQYFLRNQPQLSIEGIDISENMIAFAKANNPKASFRIMDARNINTLPNKYHGIICSFGLPYLSKEEAHILIENTYELLLPQGYLYLSTMEDDYSVSGYVGPNEGDQLYTYYHLGSELEKELLDRGFKVDSITRQPFEHDNGTQFTDVIIIAHKP